MLRFPLLIATGGLAISCVMWSLPLLFGAASVPGAILADAPRMPRILTAATAHDRSRSPGLLDAFLALTSADAEAINVAGVALQPNPPADLGPRAERVGNQVRDAALSYVNVVRTIVDSSPRH